MNNERNRNYDYPTLPDRAPQVCGARCKAGKSNRAIAKELGVDEGTIRRDRKFLTTPEDQRPVKVPRPKKPQKERPVRELSPDESRRRYQQHMLTVVEALDLSGEPPPT